MTLQPAATYRAPDGMVCAIDHLAAGAGAAMLRHGGSAADAAVATSAVLSVTTQHMCGMGGDLFAVLTPPGEEPLALNASGRAGSGADPERLRAAGHATMPFRGDIASVPVPGCVDGWLALHGRFGRLPLEEVLAPAVRYAEGGFPVSDLLAEEFSSVAHLEAAGDYLVGGPIYPGKIVRRPGAARALRAIAREGRDGFYGGEFGEQLLALGGGEYAPGDLERPLADYTPAISIEAFGQRVWTAPPNSAGYLSLASAFIASGLDLPEDPANPLFAHLLIESARLASYDRLAVLAEGADPARLLDRSELEARRERIDPLRAVELGGAYAGGGTICLTAVDRDRLGISLLQSNAAGFGSHLALPGLRIFLHNRGIGFSLEAGHPAEYGPGRRPPHTLCPTAVTRPDGRLLGVLGSMGGDGQPQTVLQLLARWLSSGESPGDALAAGRFLLGPLDGGSGFDTWRERGRVRVLLEGQAPAAWDEGLARRGHTVVRTEAFGRLFGHAHLIAVGDGHLYGATDPRPGSGAAAGL